ncbi:MAG: type III pantothenate kinase [Ignavibacteria bacterium]|nr:type III pantothenate kinase [Ignavibacteria bacterium]
MNLAIDIGNSFTHFAVYKDSRNVYTYNCSSINRIDLVKAIKKISKKFRIIKIGISSVSADTLKIIKSYIRKEFKISPLTINNKTKLPVKIKIKKSHTLGPDRICNAVYGYDTVKAKCHVLMIDLGTANTYDLVLKNGDFVGGIIAPGIMTSSRALNSNTGNLPLLEYRKLSVKAPLIGRNTFEAIQSGLVNYMKCATEGLVKAIRGQYKGKLRVIVTGGSAKFLGRKVNFDHIYRKNTVLEGINIVLNYQGSSK